MFCIDRFTYLINFSYCDIKVSSDRQYPLRNTISSWVNKKKKQWKYVLPYHITEILLPKNPKRVAGTLVSARRRNKPYCKNQYGYFTGVISK